MDHLQLPLRRLRDLADAALEHVLHGPEHQGQRRAELVRHVREERRFRAVDLGQRFGALLLFFVGARVGDRVGKLRLDQIEEVAVDVVELQPGAHTQDHHARRFARFVRGDRDHGGRMRRIRPRTGRDGRELLSQPLHHLHSLRLRDFGERPDGFGGPYQIDLDGSDPFRPRDAGRAGEARPRAAVLDQVNQREGNVLRIFGEGRRCQGARFFRGLGFAQAGPEVAERAHAPLGHDLLGDLVDRRQDAADPARLRFVRHRAVRDDEVTLFEIAVAANLERDVVVPRRGPSAERAVDQRTDHMPDLGPALAGRTPERDVGMLGPRNRNVGVVVELDVLRTPPQEVREAVRQHDPEHRPQCRRPGRHGSQGCLRPVERSDPLRHLPFPEVDLLGSGGHVRLTQTHFTLLDTSSRSMDSRNASRSVRLKRRYRFAGFRLDGIFPAASQARIVFAATPSNDAAWVTVRYSRRFGTDRSGIGPLLRAGSARTLPDLANVPGRLQALCFYSPTGSVEAGRFSSCNGIPTPPRHWIR